MPRFDAAATLALVERHRVDWMYAVPTMMHRIWRLPEGERTRFDVSSLRVVFHMAAPCPPWLKQSWIDWLGGECVLELYGGTEAQVLTDIEAIPARLTEIFERARRENRPTNAVADQMARERLGRVPHKRVA